MFMALQQQDIEQPTSVLLNSPSLPNMRATGKYPVLLLPGQLGILCCGLEMFGEIKVAQTKCIRDYCNLLIVEKIKFQGLTFGYSTNIA